MEKVNGCTKLVGLVSLGQEHDDMNSPCLKGTQLEHLICVHSGNKKKKRETCIIQLPPTPPIPQPPPKITNRVHQIPRLNAIFFIVQNKIFITFLQVLNKKRYNWPAMSFSLSSLATLDSVFLLPIGQQGRWIQRHLKFTFGNQYIGFFKGDTRFITAVVMGEVPTDPLSSSTLLEKMPMLKSLQKLILTQESHLFS